MMRQFEVWTLNGERVIVLASLAHSYDFMMGFWRVVKVVHQQGEGTVRIV